MRDKIYTIAVMEELEQGEGGFPEIGLDRLVGFYINKNEAFVAVKENWCDIQEHYYNYALIEEVESGLYQGAMKGHRWWFRFNKETNEYEEIPEPEFCKYFSGFTIG